MSKFLFTVQPAMGHLNPLLTIARQMESEGHSITFVSNFPEKIAKVVSDSGFPFVNIRPSISILGYQFLPYTTGHFETFLAVKLFFSGLTHYAQTIGRVLDELQPDAIVSDFAFPGGCLAAESKDIPYIVIYSAGLGFKGPGIPPFGSGLPIGEAWGLKGKIHRLVSDYLERSIKGAIAHARKKLKLPPGKKGRNIFLSSPWLNLILTAEICEAPRFPFPETVFFIGPCFAGREGSGGNKFPFELLVHDRSKVYVSLGTVFNNKPEVYRKIIAGLADTPYQIIVSAGGAFSELRSSPLPSNVLLFERVPQVEILSRVDVVISHGGNNTVNETLAAGKPLLVMPVGGEQGDNSSRIVFLGTGLRADISKSTSPEIFGKVKRLVEDPIFRKRAKEIADGLLDTQAPLVASRFIDRIARTKQSLIRPAGYPLTVSGQMVPPWEFDV